MFLTDSSNVLDVACLDVPDRDSGILMFLKPYYLEMSCCLAQLPQERTVSIPDRTELSLGDFPTDTHSMFHLTPEDPSYLSLLRLC